MLTREEGVRMSRQDRMKASQKDKEENQEEKSSGIRDILEMILFALVVFLLFFLMRQFLFVPVSVDGPSMEPSLHHQDRLILNKIEEPDRFDIVVFQAPDHSDSQYIKRIIGMPGDTVEYKNGVLFMNGEQVYEPYLEEFKLQQPQWEFFVTDFTLQGLTGEITVPEEMYFVLGDNRSNSKDSREFGFIDANTVQGTANFRVMPFGDFGNVNESENFPDIPDIPQTIVLDLPQPLYESLSVQSVS